VEELYARVAEAITRPGQVYHAVMEVEQEGGPFSYSGTVETWLDTKRDVARQQAEFLIGEQAKRSRTIIAGGALYRSPTEDQSSSRVEAPRCYGGSASASSVLGCPGPTEESTKAVEAGEYGGKPVIVLVTIGTSSGADETFTFTSRLYLDPETFLPIASETEGTMDYGDVYPLRGESHFRTEFIAADSLPDDFFDPDSIGYVQRDPEEPLRTADPGITVYWLGREYEGSEGLPPLKLAGAYVPERRLPPYRLSLEYKLAEDEFGTPALALQEWDAEEWDAFLAGSRGGNWWQNPCFEERELTLDGRRAVVYLGFETELWRTGGACPTGPYDRFIAHAYVGSTVVQIEGSQVCDRDGCRNSPYDSVEGMEAIARALKPRE
jgi:hypothetical protein